MAHVGQSAFLTLMRNCPRPKIYRWTFNTPEISNLDWVWEIYKDDEETQDFLNWVCDPQTISHEGNILTDEEIERWEKLKKEKPNAILTGQRLQEALQIIR